MGDEDGARPVLQEVIASGDLRQQAEARELLINID
jgi:pilus assembly protein FimV